MQSKSINIRLILMIIALILLVTAGPVRFTYANADPGESAKATSESKNETQKRRAMTKMLTLTILTIKLLLPILQTSLKRMQEEHMAMPP